MRCVCGHTYTAHQEIVTPAGHPSGDCAGGGNNPETCCTCPNYTPDEEN